MGFDAIWWCHHVTCDVVCSKLRDGEIMRTGVQSGGLGVGVSEHIRD